MSKKTPLQRMKEDEKLLEKIMAVLPGFSGYKEKEQRREADKLIRNFLYEKLQEARNGLQDIYRALAENDLTECLAQIDRLMAIFDRVSEKVNHASYGYSGYFDAIKIEEKELDSMIAFDTQLVDGAKGLAEKVQSFREEVESSNFDNVKAFGEQLRKNIAEFEKAFDERKDVITAVEVG